MGYLTLQMKNTSGFTSQKMWEKAKKTSTCFNLLLLLWISSKMHRRQKIGADRLAPPTDLAAVGRFRRQAQYLRLSTTYLSCVYFLFLLE